MAASPSQIFTATTNPIPATTIKRTLAGSARTAWADGIALVGESRPIRFVINTPFREEKSSLTKAPNPLAHARHSHHRASAVKNPLAKDNKRLPPHCVTSAVNKAFFRRNSVRRMEMRARLPVTDANIVCGRRLKTTAASQRAFRMSRISPNSWISGGAGGSASGSFGMVSLLSCRTIRNSAIAMITKLISALMNIP